MNPIIRPEIMIIVGISFTCWEIEGSIIDIGKIHIMIAPNVIDRNLITIIGVLICIHSFIMNLGLNSRGLHTVAIAIRMEYRAVNLTEKKIRNSMYKLFVLNEALSRIMSLE
jgi:hypothetical protein